MVLLCGTSVLNSNHDFWRFNRFFNYFCERWEIDCLSDIQKKVFETVCISFGRKKELGTGARSISHYPIYLTGTVLQKDDQKERKSMMLICGYISNKVFSKFYKKQLAPILKILSKREDSVIIDWVFVKVVEEITTLFDE
ncbi:hypothetical protein ACVRXS_05555 [Streptococcus orisratti]